MTLTTLKVGDSTSAKGSALTREQRIDAVIAEIQALLQSATVNSGDLAVTGALSVVGDTTVSTLESSGNVDVGGTLGVDGAATLDSTLAVAGATQLAALNTSGDTDVEGALNADGAATLGATLAVVGNVGFNGVAPAAQAGAITPPAEQGGGYVQADVESLGTAIDAIIVALHNVGITA